MVERQVLQVTQHSDALNRERRACYRGTLTVDSLQRIDAAAGSTNAALGARRASFNVRQAPYTVAADVEIAEHPDSATLALRVALDPIHVDARFMCSAPDGNGIRSASIVASAPSWAVLRFDRVEQSPELCASSGAQTRSTAAGQCVCVPALCGR